MTAFGRRQIVLALGAMLPALSTRQLLAQAPGIPTSAIPILPPPGPMIYTRRLVRGLADNARIMVERRFAVGFTRSATGFVLDGEQVAVAVEMPEQLAPLAKLERERVETGIFPLELDGAGHIRSGEAAKDSPEIDAAMRYVTERIAASGSSEGAAEAMRDFINAIHEAGNTIVSSLPVDLFAPAEADRSASRSIDLPAGGQGLVTTEFSAERDPQTGLMRSARRAVVTRIGGDERHTNELFTLVLQ